MIVMIWNGWEVASSLFVLFGISHGIPQFPCELLIRLILLFEGDVGHSHR